MSGETVKRILVALPWAVLAVVIVILGGPVFAAALVGFGCIGLREFFQMAAVSRPLEWAACIGLTGMIAAALFGTAFNVLMLMAVPFVIMFVFAAARADRENITASIAFTLFGLFWIGIPLAHAVLLRGLPDHGGALLINVLIGTFVADTGAYAVGRMFGSRKLAPSLSPNKTVEGLIGGVLLGILAVWSAGLYQDWLSGFEALILGAAVASVAPIGDLFESMIKRDLETKDTGTLFGPHGGLLDRLDAVFFTVVIGYYVSIALLY